MLLYLLIFMPMAAGLVSFPLGRRSVKARNILAVAATLLSTAVAAALFSVPDTRQCIPGICGLSLSFELDGFRRVYLLIACFMWLITTVAGNEYFSHYSTCGRYYSFNLVTLGATAGVFLAADLFTALVFFEIMSFTSFTWVIQEETEGAIRAANTYLAVAVIGGLTALMGLFLLQNKLGTTEISKLYALAAACPDKGTLYAAGACILFGFGAKAGMFPLHIWLPKAHPVAPAPASALLSGILTKSGIFGILAITCNLFRYDPAWGKWILGIGTVTMLLGALLALFSIDLKRTLACSSVSQIGFILVGIGMTAILGHEGAMAARGTLLHMMNHSMFKLILFLCAAVVYMNLHRLNLNEIRGFGRGKPALLFAFLMGALGIGGIPGWSGYVSKTLLHESIVEYAGILKAAGQNTAWMHAVEWIFLFSGGITLAYMTKLFVALFMERGPGEKTEKKSYAKPLTLAAILLPAILIPLFGLTASRSMDSIASVGTDFFHAGALEEAVHYFSFENLKGALISLGIGAVLYFGFVRTCLMKKTDGGKEYVNRWPAWLDLEELLYRPLLLSWLPGVLGWISAVFGENRVTAPLCKSVLKAAGAVSEAAGENRLTEPAAKAVFRGSGFLSQAAGDNMVTGKTALCIRRGADILMHALSDSADALVFGLRKTVFRERHVPPEEGAEASVLFRFGEQVDRIRIRKGREREGGKEVATKIYRADKTLKETTGRIHGNMSFALIMLCIAVCLILTYLIILHG